MSGDDELRRRLYRADATEDDVRRYLHARPPEEPRPQEEPATAPSHPRRRRIPVVVAVLAAAGLTAAALLARPGAESPAAGPTAPPVLQDVGEGRMLDVGRGSASTATAVLTRVAGSPVLGRRVEGRGNAVVALDPVDSRPAAGRAVVAVVAEGDDRVTWRALLDVPHPDWTTTVFVLARGRAGTPSAPVAATTFVYPTRPPTGLAVTAPEGARWTLVYARSPEPASD